MAEDAIKRSFGYRDTFHKAAVRAFQIGDYFGLEEIKSFACRAIREDNVKQAAFFQKKLDITGEEPCQSKGDLRAFFRDSAFLERYLKQAVFVYTQQSASFQPLRRAFHHLVECTRYLLPYDTTVMQACEDQPNFGLALFRSLYHDMDGDNTVPLIRTNFPAKCYSCDEKVLSGQGLNFFRDTYFEDRLDGDMLALAGQCQRCFVKVRGGSDL